MVRWFVSAVIVMAGSGAPATAAGRASAGIQAAFALEQGRLFGSGPSSGTRLVLFQPQLAVAALRSADQPFLEAVTEVSIAESVAPTRRFLLSVNIGARSHLRPTRTLGGYVEAGAGIGSSALEVRQLNGWLQYHLQVGAGLRFRVGTGSLRLGYRLTHFSNHGTTLPNPGLNLHTVVVGYQTALF